MGANCDTLGPPNYLGNKQKDDGNEETHYIEIR